MVRRAVHETASSLAPFPPGGSPFRSAVVIPVVIIIIVVVAVVIIVVIFVAIVVVIVVVIVVAIIIIVVIISAIVVVIVVVLVTAGLVGILTVMVPLVVVVQGRTMRWRGADDRVTEDVSPGPRQQAWHTDDRDQENGHQQHANSPHGPDPQLY